MSVLAEIKLRLKEHEDEMEELEEMDLSELKIGKFTPEILAYLNTFKNVKVIVLNNCELETLENMPKWDIYVIDLSDNKLGPSAIPILATYKNMNQLIFAHNNITSLDAFKPLAALENIAEVDFSENPVATNTNYRTWLFENIPNLEVIDGTDKDGNAVEEESEFAENSDDDDEEDVDEDQQEDYQDVSESEESAKPQKKKK